LLKTPTSQLAVNGGSQHPDKRKEGGHGPTLADEVEHLLPTPVAQPSGNSPQVHLRKKPGRQQVTDLAIIAENGLLSTGGQLLPTPTAMDSQASGGNSPSNRTLTEATVRESLGARTNPRFADGNTLWDE